MLVSSARPHDGGWRERAATRGAGAQDCMHVSPYVLVLLFAGEVSGYVCACAAQLLVAFECLIDAVYVLLTEA